MKAALEAWGSKSNLFHQGFAAETDDPDVIVVRGTYTTNDKLDGKVVVYDPERDLAVIFVPGLRAPVMPFAKKPAGTGANAVVLGYPLDGPYDAKSARVREVSNITGPDIYDSGDVTREIYTIYAKVRSGNSGGPLLDPCGRVVGVNSFGAESGGADAEFYFAISTRELLPFLREQVISMTAHRYGNPDAQMASIEL